MLNLYIRCGNFKKKSVKAVFILVEIQCDHSGNSMLLYIRVSQNLTSDILHDCIFNGQHRIFDVFSFLGVKREEHIGCIFDASLRIFSVFAKQGKTLNIQVAK